MLLELTIVKLNVKNNLYKTSYSSVKVAHTDPVEVVNAAMVRALAISQPQNH